MEDKHDVQLLPFHLDLDRYHDFVAMGWFLYPNMIMKCKYSSMCLLIGFLSGAMLVHNKFVDTHSPTLMTFVSLYGVDGDIQQL